MSENCYFYIDQNLPEEQKAVEAMCCKCHEMPENSALGGWFWPGSVKGYGPYDIVCNLCGHKIYVYEE